MSLRSPPISWKARLRWYPLFSPEKQWIDIPFLLQSFLDLRFPIILRSWEGGSTNASLMCRGKLENTGCDSTNCLIHPVSSSTVSLRDLTVATALDSISSMRFRAIVWGMTGQPSWIVTSRRPRTGWWTCRPWESQLILHPRSSVIMPMGTMGSVPGSPMMTPVGESFIGTCLSPAKVTWTWGKWLIFSPFRLPLKGWVAPLSSKPCVGDCANLEILKGFNWIFRSSSNSFWRSAIRDSWLLVLATFSWTSGWPMFFSIRLASSKRTFIASSFLSSSITSSFFPGVSEEADAADEPFSFSEFLTALAALAVDFSSPRVQEFAKWSLAPQCQHLFSWSRTCP